MPAEQVVEVGHRVLIAIEHADSRLAQRHTVECTELRHHFFRVAEISFDAVDGIVNRSVYKQLIALTIDATDSITALVVHLDRESITQCVFYGVYKRYIVECGSK